MKSKNGKSSEATVQLLDIPQEFQLQLENTLNSYLEQFPTPQEKLWATAGFNRACRKAMMKPLTPIIRDVCASPPLKHSDLQPYITECNAIMSEIGIAIRHPKSTKDSEIPGILKAIGDPQANEEIDDKHKRTSYLYIQPRNSNDKVKLVGIQTREVTNRSGSIPPSNIELIEASRKEGRASIRII